MIVVDASVWVSALMPGEVHHHQSRLWFDRWHKEDQRIVAPVLVVGEVAGAISRRTGAPAVGRRAAMSLFAFPNPRLISIADELGQLVATLAADLGLRGADATDVAVAQQFDVPLLTWDRDQASRAGEIAVAAAPGELDDDV